MTAYRIRTVSPVLAFDSRGNPTVSCEVELTGGARATAIVPSGASTGTHEAVEMRDGGPSFGGLGVSAALANVAGEIAATVVGREVRTPDDLAVLDADMRALDGTPDLRRLGANAILSISVATALAAAAQSGMEPYRWFAMEDEPLLPMPMINIFSGGAHAASALDVQDLLVVPVGAADVQQALQWAWEVRAAVGRLLGARGLNHRLVADEGGFGVPLCSTTEGLALLVDGIEAAGLAPGEQVALAVDIAATQLFHDGSYRLAAEGRVLTSAEFVDEVARWCDGYPIVSVEDVLAEDDWPGWAYASDRLRDIQLLGDDLFVTSADRLRRGVDQKIASAVLVKPNQCGTLSAARHVVRVAQRVGYATVLSARSGETEDSWLADVAVGWRTGQVKVGSLTRSERTSKWNRLLRISHQLGEGAVFADRDRLVTPTRAFRAELLAEASTRDL